MNYIKTNNIPISNKTDIERVLKWIDLCVNNYLESKKTIKKNQL